MRTDRSFKTKIVSSAQAVEIVQQWQENRQKVVFTNGCFDIVHRGHVEYLSAAAQKGNRLVLGLNTDASVKRIKGPTRPVVDEHSRATILAAFEFIDLVVPFDEDTPYELIKAIQPDVLVKGADYKAEDIVGYDIVMQKGGSVETIEFVAGFSTTDIIGKLSNPGTINN
ncbi:rfaE bifunctional protein, domain II [Saccharicrinis carchari]|uniref:D-glycero-beta-D-manno-heptose 1-phosphate adenylyltransferase n=1 Tax=Saccharicrinis carchari TaxID=1168039 RepID=A0A521CSF4_SACCC|nr:D-glycero-beta-D-manno-heptose 1-phosphate adenylyltransferase [Saccharicrinis carchari]SMO62383.1 rfaE bifunctional protein, domain II [Saccharicrinis carchari]